MSNTIASAFMGTAGSIEALVRAIVRDELRKHIGPEADHFINVRSGPMSARKLRHLVRSGELHGFKQGRDTFISASAFRAYIERKPVPKPKPVVVPEPPVSPEQDGYDDMMVIFGLVPTDPRGHGAFEARLAQRRAEGGVRAASLRQAEGERVQLDENARRREELRRRREETKKRKGRK